MFILKILAIAALIGSIAWTIADPGYEPAIAIITSISALIGLYIAGRSKKDPINQNQKVSGKGIGLQSGRDINIGNGK